MRVMGVMGRTERPDSEDCPEREKKKERKVEVRGRRGAVDGPVEGGEGGVTGTGFHLPCFYTLFGVSRQKRVKFYQKNTYFAP